MGQILQPKNFMEANSLPTLLMELSGMCPFTFNLKEYKFYISWPKMMITMAHFTVYTYLQLTTILNDFDDYKQPVLAISWVNVQINLILKLVGIMMTFTVVSTRLFSATSLKKQLNGFLKAIKLYEQIGDDLFSLYRKTQIFILIIMCWSFTFTGLSIWHNFHYFKLITGREPKLTLKCLIIMSYYYKSVFLAYIWTTVIEVYYITRSTNKIIKKTLQTQSKNVKEKSTWNLA